MTVCAKHSTYVNLRDPNEIRGLGVRWGLPGGLLRKAQAPEYQMHPSDSDSELLEATLDLVVLES